MTSAWFTLFLVISSHCLGLAAAQQVPRLIYNCAKMPAICNNVGRTLPIQNNKLVNGVAKFTWTGGGSKHRDKVCSSNWAGPCPETNPPQPLVVGYNTVTKKMVKFKGSQLYPDAAKGKGYNMIANEKGEYSGMMWTCDECKSSESVYQRSLLIPPPSPAKFVRSTTYQLKHID